jgi:regulator of sigma E protease
MFVNVVINTLALLLVLSVLVVVHEFGHFAVAKLFKFPVEVFSFGFGKRLFGRTWRGTDYRVSAIPLGGYVRVIGLGPDESTVSEGTSKDASLEGKRWQRALILLAGPLMNLVLALFLHAIVFAIGVRVPAYQLQEPVVDAVAPDSPGEAARLLPGDRILSIDGKEIRNWRDAEFIFAMNAREELDVEVARGGETLILPLTPRGESRYDLGITGLRPDYGGTVNPAFAEVRKGEPAWRAGLRPGDRILSVAGRPITGGPEQYHEQFVAAIMSVPSGPVPIEVERDGKRITANVTPRQEGSTRKVGVSIGHDLPEVLERFGPVASIREGWRRVQTDFVMTLNVLGRLFRGKASMKSMSGPLDIAKFSGEAARRGAVPLIALMAAISLQLGIFNLLPIPVLDGGHLFLLTLEGVARRDFSLRVKERILQVGFLMIVTLLVVVLYNDLVKNVPAGWWPF